MKVSEFKKLVAEIPEEMNDCEVILQGDEEGNFYNELRYVDGNGVHADSTPGYHYEWSASDADFDSEEEWNEHRNRHRAVILAP